MDFMKYDFNVTDIRLVCHVPKNGGSRVHKNRASHGVVFYPSGEREYLFDGGRSINVCKNKIAYLPQSSTYVVNVSAPGDCYAINFMLSEEVDFEPFSVKIKNSEQISELFRSCLKIWKERKRGYQMECKAYLYRILCILQREAEDDYLPNEKARLIAPAVDYLREKYTSDDVSIARLSALCGITPEYFRRVFRGVFGTSPLSYINNLKLNNARELLDSGMYTVSDSARASGYSDMSHFSREFKKKYGVSPRDYVGRR